MSANNRRASFELPANQKIGLTFFFGAGAEAGEENFGLAIGVEYNNKTVDQPNGKVVEALRRRFPTVKNSFLKAASVQSELDGLFHSIALINERESLHLDSFSKIFNYYWLCYFAIANDVNRFFGLDRFVDNPSEIMNNLVEYGKIIDEIDVNRAIVERPESYYSCLKEWLVSHNDTYVCLGIGTSNYFRFCEAVSEDVRPCYLNGQLGLFEYPDIFEIKRIKKEPMPNEIFFPFMFGQSYTKPIVDETQIRYFNRFSRHLKRSRFLIVVGYGVNRTDNHINALFAKHIRQTNNTVIFVVENEGEKNNTLEIVNKVKRKRTVRFVFWKRTDGEKKKPKEVLDEVFSIVEEKTRILLEKRKRTKESNPTISE